MALFTRISAIPPQRSLRPASPPSEVWDNDEDFDWTLMSGNALELPRSDAGSEEQGRADDDDAEGDDNADRAERDGWDAQFADEEKDEDQVDTIKVSELAAATLAQLASLRKGPGLGQSDIGNASLGDLSGMVTNLGTYTKKPVAVDMEAGGDWDEDLEVPETFPGLRLSQHASSFASDLDVGTPSVGSTSDATTTASTTSEVQGKNTESLIAGSARESESPAPSLSSSFASPSKKAGSLKGTSGEKGKKDINEEQEEKGFDLPGQISTLQLGPNIGRIRSNAELDQQRLLWEEDDKRSESARHRVEKGSSLSESSAKESDAIAEFEGVDITDQIFARTGEKAPSVASALQAKLNSRKRSVLETSAHKDASATGRDADFSRGLVITEDLNLSVNRLRAKNFGHRAREAAQHRRGDTGPGLASQKAEPSKIIVTKSEQSSASRLTASTKASRAREVAPRCESPRPSPSLDGAQWNRSTASTTSEGLSSTYASRRSRQGQSQDTVERGVIMDRPLTPSITLPSRGESTSRYSMPTAASRARQSVTSRASTSSPLGTPAVTRLMRGPRRPRVYGNGKELEGFDDLPVHREKETARLNAEGKLRNPKVGRMADVQKHTSLPTKPSVSTTRSKLTTTKASTSSSSDLTASTSRSGRVKRKQPTLIRNLGGPSTAPRVEGGCMKWNSSLRRWEGNEEEGREFERAVRGTGRPALITRLATGNQAVSASKSILPTSPTSTGARVVGDMIFDTVRLCWLNKNKEDEVDPFAGMDDDSDDDIQQNGPGSSNLKAGKIPMKSSSTSLRQRSDGQSAIQSSPQWSASAISRILKGPKKDLPSSLSDRIPAALWTECIAAKTRHDEEMAPFSPTKQQQHTKNKLSPARDRNSHLYLIQSLARRASL